MRADRGFTLMEVLAALVLLGLLMVALSQGVRFGLQAWSMQVRQVAMRGDLDTVDRTLRGLIERMEAGGPEAALPLRGGPRSVSFTTVLPTAVGQGLERVSDVTLAVDGGHRLTLMSAPHKVSWLVPPPPAEQTTLLDGVDRIELAYWADRAWTDQWTARALPHLVRVRIVFADRRQRRWPDIVAGPMRDAMRP